MTSLLVLQQEGASRGMTGAVLYCYVGVRETPPNNTATNNNENAVSM